MRLQRVSRKYLQCEYGSAFSAARLGGSCRRRRRTQGRSQTRMRGALRSPTRRSARTRGRLRCTTRANERASSSSAISRRFAITSASEPARAQRPSSMRAGAGSRLRCAARVAERALRELVRKPLQPQPWTTEITENTETPSRAKIFSVISVFSVVQGLVVQGVARNVERCVMQACGSQYVLPYTRRARYARAPPTAIQPSFAATAHRPQCRPIRGC